LNRPSGPGLDIPFDFDILAQLANIPARITIQELLRLSKEIREALRDALADSESFLTYMQEVSQDDIQPLYTECHHIQLKIPAIAFTVRICSSRIINTIDPCTILGTSARRSSEGTG